jgi:hypothetical protein
VKIEVEMPNDLNSRSIAIDEDGRIVRIYCAATCLKHGFVDWIANERAVFCSGQTVTRGHAKGHEASRITNVIVAPVRSASCRNEI